MYLLRCDVQVPLSKGKVLILQDVFWEGVDPPKGAAIGSPMKLDSDYTTFLLCVILPGFL